MSGGGCLYSLGRERGPADILDLDLGPPRLWSVDCRGRKVPTWQLVMIALGNEHALLGCFLPRTLHSDTFSSTRCGRVFLVGYWKGNGNARPLVGGPPRRASLSRLLACEFSSLVRRERRPLTHLAWPLCLLTSQGTAGTGGRGRQGRSGRWPTCLGGVCVWLCLCVSAGPSRSLWTLDGVRDVFSPYPPLLGPSFYMFLLT